MKQSFRKPPMLIVVVFVSVLGCATTAPVARLSSFHVEEYAPYDTSGSGTITGQAFAKTKGGEVRYAAGDSVLLVPVTSYSKEWWGRSVLGAVQLESPDSRATSRSRGTVADGEGHFRFERIPPGDYYVVSSLGWQTGAYSWQRSDVVLASEVKVAAGEQLKIILERVRYRNRSYLGWNKAR